MVDLDFAVEDVTIDRHAMVPTLNFALKIANRTPECRVLSVMLNCQLRVEPARRAYAAAERERLSELFGASGRWSESLQSFLWAHVGLTVRGFEGECAVGLPVPCSFDFNVAATKYFAGLDDGAVPVAFLFSGSVFYRAPDGQLQIGQISWTKDSAYRLPVAVWRELVEHYHPHAAWLCLERDAFDALCRYKRQRGLPTFERAIEELIERQPVEALA
ncbi:MAG TPA: DUF6084 family protein [Stellaceae bacterium]|jgi:hypothetical protein|nr:DUF6084 family protein [Stellaceae bacterium]